MESIPKSKSKYGFQYKVFSLCPYCQSTHIHKWEGLNDSFIREATCGKGQYQLDFNDRIDHEKRISVLV